MVNGTNGDVKVKVDKALYALLGLAVSGVLSMAYLWSVDVRGDIEKARGMIVELHKSMARVEATHGRLEEKVIALEKMMVRGHSLWGDKYGRDEDYR